MAVTCFLQPEYIPSKVYVARLDYKPYKLRFSA